MALPTSVDDGEVMVAEVVATETTGEPAAPASPPPPTGDARLVHRGPIQRLLVRPEIGALLGTTAIWFFFWVVAPIFGTAAGRPTTWTSPRPSASWRWPSRC